MNLPTDAGVAFDADGAAEGVVGFVIEGRDEVVAGLRAAIGDVLGATLGTAGVAFGDTGSFVK